MNRLFMPLAAVVCLAALSGTAMAQGYCRPSGYLGDAYSGYPGAGYGAQPYHQPANQYQPIGRGLAMAPYRTNRSEVDTATVADVPTDIVEFPAVATGADCSHVCGGCWAGFSHRMTAGIESRNEFQRGRSLGARPAQGSSDHALTGTVSSFRRELTAK